MKRGSQQDKENRSRAIGKENIIIGVIFIVIGVAGFLYGWEREYILGGLTWVTAFVLIGLYSFLVLAREEY